MGAHNTLQFTQNSVQMRCFPLYIWVSQLGLCSSLGWWRQAASKGAMNLLIADLIFPDYFVGDAHDNDTAGEWMETDAQSKHLT